MKILVVGGAGYIGSHMVKQLAQAGNEVLILDNLSYGYRDAVKYGEFIDGQIVSTVQRRPSGPSVDPENRALSLIRRLSLLEFGTPGLNFARDGALQPIERAPFERHELVVIPH